MSRLAAVEPVRSLTRFPGQFDVPPVPRNASADVGSLVVLVLELYGWGPAQGGVASAAVVEAFDPFEDRRGQFEARGPPLPVEDLDLQPATECLDDGVALRVEGGQQAGLAGPFGEGPGHELGAVGALLCVKRL